MHDFFFTIGGRKFVSVLEQAAIQFANGRFNPPKGWYLNVTDHENNNELTMAAETVTDSGNRIVDIQITTDQDGAWHATMFTFVRVEN